jgi:HTH-type transcriptional regulator/antitoxin HipB
MPMMVATMMMTAVVVAVDLASNFLPAYPPSPKRRRTGRGNRAAISVKRDKCLLSCITDNCHLSSKTDMKKKIDAGYPIKTPQQLGAVLQGFRKQRGLTQAQVARASGLLQSAVSELELDSSTASLNRIFKLLAALDLELVVQSRGASPKVSEW